MDKKKLDYIFCLPGHPSSGIVSEQLLACLMNLTAAGKTVSTLKAYSASVYAVRNACLGQRGFRKDQLPFQGQYDYERLIWVDSDQIVTAEDVDRLVSHDKDIVAGWARQYSTGPIDGNNYANCGRWQLEPRVPGKSPGRNEVSHYTVDFMTGFANERAEWDIKDVLLPVDYVGMAFMVVKPGVFEKIGFPWFSGYEFEWEENGVVMVNFMPEDADFCLKARAAGFTVWVDPMVKSPHQKQVLL